MIELNARNEIEEAMKSPERVKSPVTQNLAPDVGRLKEILHKKSHENFINMVAKNQARLKT